MVTNAGLSRGERYSSDHAWLAALVAQAVDMACINLDARSAPTGPMPVVLGPGYGGVLFHEAIGRGLEGDRHRKNQAAFTGRIGTFGIDDEGVAGAWTPLIEDGRCRRGRPAAIAGVRRDMVWAVAMAPAIDDVADSYAGWVAAAKIDIETSSALADSFGVRGVPTLVLRRGGQEVDRHVGMLTRTRLSLLLDDTLARGQALA